MRFRRERSCSVEMPGSTRWSSTKRRGPAARSRTMRSVHLSPTRSSARVSGDHWSYGCRLGGGKPAMGPTSVLFVLSFQAAPRTYLLADWITDSTIYCDGSYEHPPNDVGTVRSCTFLAASFPLAARCSFRTWTAAGRGSDGRRDQSGRAP